VISARCVRLLFPLNQPRYVRGNLCVLHGGWYGTRVLMGQISVELGLRDLVGTRLYRGRLREYPGDNEMVRTIRQGLAGQHWDSSGDRGG